MQQNKSKPKPSMVMALIAFLTLSALMYATITYKIIHYGP